MKNLVIIFILFRSVTIYALDINEITQIIENSIKKNQKIDNSGISIAVFTKDQILVQKAYGLKDREKNLKTTPYTLFAIGSTTKAFTALDLKILEQDHQLTLDDKVENILPDFKLSNSAISSAVTIEDLLSHRIGLPRHDFLWYFAPFNRHELILFNIIIY